jgi:hypothetical protein
MRRLRLRWVTHAFAVASVALIGLPVVYGQSTEQTSGGQPAYQESTADLAQKDAVAEQLLAQREGNAGRPLDPAFRQRLKAGLASSLSMEQLDAALTRIGPIQPNVIGQSSADLVYTPLPPCRIIDTRLGGGPIAANTDRNFVVAGSGNMSGQGGSATGCGVPFGPATAVMLNFTAVGAAGAGNLRGYAFATPAPPFPNASLVNYGIVSGLNAIANGVVVPICDVTVTSCTSDLIIRVANSATDVVVDVLGYFQAVSTQYEVVSQSFPITLCGGNVCGILRSVTCPPERRSSAVAWIMGISK